MQRALESADPVADTQMVHVGGLLPGGITVLWTLVPRPIGGIPLGVARANSFARELGSKHTGKQSVGAPSSSSEEGGGRTDRTVLLREPLRPPPFAARRMGHPRIVR